MPELGTWIVGRVRRGIRVAALAFVSPISVLCLLVFFCAPGTGFESGALALSQIKEAPTVTEDAAENDEPGDDGEPPSLPLPDAGTSGDAATTDEMEEESATAEQPVVEHDLSILPEPVQRMRQLIVDTAATGDLDALRPLLGTGPTRTQISLTAYDGDPVEFLRDASGDEEGQEILAIILDLFASGFVHLDAGTPQEVYLWPYFFVTPLDGLTPPQRVELFRLITAGDYQDMRAFGGYNFYRIGISPDGEWKFFVAGD